MRLEDTVNPVAMQNMQVHQNAATAVKLTHRGDRAYCLRQLFHPRAPRLQAALAF